MGAAGLHRGSPDVVARPRDGTRRRPRISRRGTPFSNALARADEPRFALAPDAMGPSMSALACRGPARIVVNGTCDPGRIRGHETVGRVAAFGEPVP